MSDPYSTMPPPPSGGQFPDRFVFNAPGQSVEGLLRDVRMSNGGQYDPCPIMDIQTAQVDPTGHPVCWSVFCNPTSLWRQLNSQRPPIGSLVRVTFTGYDGQAKIFQLDVAPGNGAPMVPMAQAAAAAPVQQGQGFAPAGAPAAPWDAAPAAVPATAAPTPPWGQ